MLASTMEITSRVRFIDNSSLSSPSSTLHHPQPSCRLRSQQELGGSPASMKGMLGVGERKACHVVPVC
jgi:hypothetical protein